MISVVIPAKNEALNLPTLLDEVVEALDGLTDFEILVVDDGSDDHSLSVLTEWRAGDARLRILQHDRSYGQSVGLRSGVQAARYPWIATLDGDGQNHPGDLPAFWQARPEGELQQLAWLAIGHRVERIDQSRKRWASRFANALRQRVLRDQTPDTGCGIKLFPRAHFLRLPWFNHMHRYLPALTLRDGGQAVSIPVRHRARQGGVSNYGVWDRAWVGIWDLMGVRWLIRRGATPRITEIQSEEQTP